jgi:alkanesulfonate monooxygenase SsuD/methylene tetrahydromethanopterin reductase-like flavin-dependent oxidoreductase (luciferase family)
MEIAVMIRHQNGADWDELLSGVKEVERHGFSAVFFPDHYLAIESGTSSDGSVMRTNIKNAIGPSDAWTVISALIMHTSVIRFGTMMTSSTFRYPGPLAVAVAQINRFSESRVELGIGAGWLEAEHAAFGLPFPSQRERFSRLEEQLSIITGLWKTQTGASFDFAGNYFTIRHSAGIPHPGRLVPPRILIGGRGLKVTPRLAATFADEVNFASLARPPEAAQEFYGACYRECQRLGRDPDTLRRSVHMPICCGEDDADIDRHLAAAGLTRDQVDRDRICTPSELIMRLNAWQDEGVDRVVLAPRGGVDLPSLQLLGESVVPSFR